MMELMIAEKIRRFRREKDVTQEQMAQAIGVSAQSVSKWECGDGNCIRRMKNKCLTSPHCCA